MLRDLAFDHTRPRDYFVWWTAQSHQDRTTPHADVILWWENPEVLCPRMRTRCVVGCDSYVRDGPPLSGSM